MEALERRQLLSAGVAPAEGPAPALGDGQSAPGMMAPALFDSVLSPTVTAVGTPAVDAVNDDPSPYPLMTVEAGAYPREYVVAGRYVYFSMNVPTTHKQQLWRTDGTAAGTTLIYESEADGSVRPLARVGAGEGLLFNVDTIDGGPSLWTTDGTAEETRAVLGFPGDAMGVGLIGTPVPMGDRTFFLATHQATLDALWVTDGTAAGTQLIRSFVESLDSLAQAGPGRLAITDTFDYRVHGLWVSDGTALGTARAITLDEEAQRPTVIIKDSLVPSGDGSRAYFFGYDADDERALYVTDGTVAGTRRLADLPEDPLGDGSFVLGAAGERGAFVIMDSLEYSLFYLDGSEGSTLRPMSSELTSYRIPTLFGNAIWLNRTRYDEMTGKAVYELHKIDLADGALRMVQSGLSGGKFTIVGDDLYILAGGNSTVERLWRFDAAGNGEVVVDDLQRQVNETYVFSSDVPFALHDGIAYYTTGDDETGHTPIAMRVGAASPPPPNVAPVARIGGPYTLLPTQPSVTLDASGSTDANGDALTFTWDLDGDGAFDDAGGAAPTLAISSLTALGFIDNAARTVAVRVDDGKGATADASTTLTLLPAPPIPPAAMLSSAFGRITWPAVFVSGDRGTAQIVVTNAGATALRGAMSVSLYASSDASLDAGDMLLESGTAPASRAIRLGAGGRATLTQRFTAPPSLADGHYVLLAQVTPSGIADAVPVTAVSNDTYRKVRSFGQVGERRNVRLRIAENDGTIVTYALAGPGTGALTTDGDASTDVALTGTTAATRLTITTAGGSDGVASIDDLTADGPLGTINGAHVNLAGSLSIPGDVKSIVLNNLLASSTVSLRGAAASTLRFNNMNGASLNATAFVRSLVFTGEIAGSTLGARGGFGTITIAGNVSDSSISAGSMTAPPPPSATIGRLLVSGAATSLRVGANAASDGSQLRPGGNIRSLTIAGPVSDDSRFIAALLPSRVTLGGQRVDVLTDPRFQS